MHLTVLGNHFFIALVYMSQDSSQVFHDPPSSASALKIVFLMDVHCLHPFMDHSVLGRKLCLGVCLKCPLIVCNHGEVWVWRITMKTETNSWVVTPEQCADLGNGLVSNPWKRPCSPCQNKYQLNSLRNTTTTA